MNIAGVQFKTSSPPGTRLSAPGGAHAFPAAAYHGSRDAISIRVQAGLPGTGSLQPLCQYGADWLVLSDGSERWLRFGGTVPFWLAHWPVGAIEATAYCGPPYVLSADGCVLRDPLGYPLDQLLLIYYLAARQGLILHAAGLCVAGQSLIFPGISGAGKTTITRQFMARNWPHLLSDDRIIVRRLDRRYWAFGTPWPGDAGVAVNAGAPLSALLFLAQGGTDEIRRLSPQDALERLLPATSIPWYDVAVLGPPLDTCADLAGTVPAFELRWTPSPAVVDTITDLVQSFPIGPPN